MPFNIYTFVLSEKLASDEFAKRGVTDKDSVRRTALITGFLSPPNGGINGAVMPALFAKEKASRDAEAAVVRPAPPPPPPPDTQEPPPPPPAEQDPGVDARLKAIEAAFGTYANFIGKTVAVAKAELEKNFVVAVKDETGNIVIDAPPEAAIVAQQPDPNGTAKLLKGVLVSLIIKKK